MAAAGKRTLRVMVPAPELRSGPGRAWALAVLAAVVLALAGVVSRPAHAAAKASVTVKNYSYSVPDLVIDPGTEVTWTATQGDHTVTSEGGSFDELIAADSAPHSFTYTFTKPGKYTYYCGFHRAKGMEAVVEVRGAPGETTTTAAPTTTSAPMPTSASTVPVTTRAAPSATAPAAPPTSARPAQAGPAKGPAAAPATTSTSTAAMPPPAAVTSTAPAPPAVAQPPAGDTTPPRSLNLAAPAPIHHRRSDTAAAETDNGDGSFPALALLLGAVGLLAAAGMGAGVWRRRR